MADCKDYQIIEALINQLKTITTEDAYNTQVSHVFIPKKILKWPGYPAIALFYNENNLGEEGFFKEQSTLEAVLVYTDGNNDEAEDQESYIVRYRNVAADIRKCIMSNVGLGGLCEYVNIESSQPALFVDGETIIEAHITFLKIERSQNLYDPYQ
jgi:hypothetical protein